MNGPPLMTVASSVHRFLLADEIATSLMAGRSVVLTHTESVSDVLALVVDALIEAGIRTLSLDHVSEGSSFLAQFAREWLTGGVGAETPAVIPPRGSDKHFVLVIDQVQRFPVGTFQQLESMAQAWPRMQVLLAGPPGIAELAHSNWQQLIPCRTWITVTLPVTKTAIQSSVSGHAEFEAALSKPAIQPIDPPLASVADLAALTAVAEPVQVAVSRPPLRRAVITWTTFSAVISLLIFVAVPKLPLDLHEALRNVGWVSPSVGPDRATAGNPGNARVTPSVADIAQTSLPEGPTPPQVSELDQVTFSQATGMLTEPGKYTHQNEQSAPIAEAPAGSAVAGSAVMDPAVSPAPVVPQPVPETANELVSVAVPSSPVLDQQLVPIPREPQPTLVPPVAAGMVDAMTRRGLAMLDFGDVSAARLLLARAAAAGSGAAAFAMGTTFDAKTLERLGAVGIAPDQATAEVWYRLALKLGDDRARLMLGGPSTSVADGKRGAAP